MTYSKFTVVQAILTIHVTLHYFSIIMLAPTSI